MCRVRRVDYSSRTGSYQAWQALFYQPITEHKARLRGRSTRRSVNKAYRSGPLAWQRPGFPWVIGLGTASQQRLPSSSDNSHFSTQDHLHRGRAQERVKTHALSADVASETLSPSVGAATMRLLGQVYEG